jgi:hypothetical protein
VATLVCSAGVDLGSPVQLPPRRGVIAGSKGASPAHSSSVSSNPRFTAGFYRINRAPPKPTHRSEKHAPGALHCRREHESPVLIRLLLLGASSAASCRTGRALAGNPDDDLAVLARGGAALEGQGRLRQRERRVDRDAVATT